MFWRSDFKISYFSSPGLRVKFSNDVETGAPRAQKFKKKTKKNESDCNKTGRERVLVVSRQCSFSESCCMHYIMYFLYRKTHRSQSVPIGPDGIWSGPDWSQSVILTPIDPDRHETLTQTHQYMFCFTPTAIDIRSAQNFPQGWPPCPNYFPWPRAPNIIPWAPCPNYFPWPRAPKYYSLGLVP